MTHGHPPHTPVPRPWPLALGGIVAWLVFALVAIAPARGEVPTHDVSILADEYRLKAEYLFRFLSYVDWPESGVDTNETDLVIGYRGDDTLKEALLPLEGRQSNNRRVTLRPVRGVGDMAGCRMIFVSAIGKGEMEQLVATARERHILTVSDRRGFIRAGGIIGFVRRGANIRFEVNNRAARQAGLGISSHLLKLATTVIE